MRNPTQINEESLALSIEELIPNDPFISPNCCIFKIPNILFRHNEKAYTPDAFSIGPFHHGKPHLQPTEKIKLKYLQGLLLRSPSPESHLRYLIGEITKLQSEARQSYAETIHFTDEEFVKMLLLDGCFIIELFRKFPKFPDTVDEDDPIFSMSCMLQYLYHDLILLENQIPWIILHKLFEITITDQPDQPNKISLPELTIIFFSNIFSSNSSLVSFTGVHNKHILDVLRNWMIISSSKSYKQNDMGLQQIPSVTGLVEAGVILKKGTSPSILDITFSDGILEIPSLLIQETTEVIFRNLISFEQCSPGCRPFITSYAKFLDNLITTTKDVECLCNAGIFDNWLNFKDATEFFSKLYLDTFMNEFHYVKVCDEMNKYSQRRWPEWRAAYVRNYFGTPWAIASQVVAFILLVCTIVQTMFTVFW